MDQEKVFYTILGMSVVTYLPRVLPLILLSYKTLPKVVSSWLSFVPVAVLSAMLFPALFIKNSQINFSFDNLFLWAAPITIFVAWKTKSLFGSVIIGMLLVGIGQYLLAK